MTVLRALLVPMGLATLLAMGQVGAGDTPTCAGARLPALPYPRRICSTGDVDGDGQLDLLVLVRKPTRRDARVSWRPFVYTRQGDRWVPKWLGSRLGRPLLEARFARTPAGLRLVSLERTRQGQVVITRYHWTGFGFWGEWTSRPYPVLRELHVTDRQGDGVDELSCRGNDGVLRFGYRAGGYVEGVTR